MTELDKDIVDLFARRAYDVAGSLDGVRVFLNGKRLPIKSFKDYVDLYLKDKTDDMGQPLKMAYENCGSRWEVAVAPSQAGFQQVDGFILNSLHNIGYVVCFWVHCHMKVLSCFFLNSCFWFHVGNESCRGLVVELRLSLERSRVLFLVKVTGYVRASGPKMLQLQQL